MSKQNQPKSQDVPSSVDKSTILMVTLGTPHISWLPMVAPGMRSEVHHGEQLSRHRVALLRPLRSVDPLRRYQCGGLLTRPGWGGAGLTRGAVHRPEIGLNSLVTAHLTGYYCYRYLDAQPKIETALVNFEPVNGGQDQACRGLSESDNRESYFTVESSQSLEALGPLGGRVGCGRWASPDLLATGVGQCPVSSAQVVHIPQSHTLTRFD